jgi:hypothetical protein
LIALENKDVEIALFKKEGTYLLGLLVVVIVIFKIVFYKEELLTLSWAVLSFFFTFTIPGFILCYLWEDKLDFIERFIVGNMLGLILVGILSYNLSVYTLINIKYLSIAVPLIVAIISGLIVYYFIFERNI